MHQSLLWSEYDRFKLGVHVSLSQELKAFIDFSNIPKEHEEDNIVHLKTKKLTTKESSVRTFKTSRF